MKISVAARAAGCSVRAIRHYHASGALPEPARLVNGYRDYTISDLAALLRIRTLVSAGVTLAEITSGSSSPVATAFSRLEQREAELARQRFELERLNEGTVGLPAHIRHALLDLLGNTAYARMEIDSLELMALSGVATSATWEVIKANLSDLTRRRESQRVGELWASLEHLSPTSPAAEKAMAELNTLSAGGVTAGLLLTLKPGDIDLHIEDIADLSSVQERALREATGQ